MHNETKSQDNDKLLILTDSVTCYAK